ncbi:histone acetyltransferase HPA2 [Pseudomonas sp.]|uniref:DUF7931 domain-containing protein n=1 Tax=Pseudomonas sp. TaxID=306 RepID=UPI0028A9AE3A|nr:histone acetyltransferase HPA2 [Pseudomonas sp.]
MSTDDPERSGAELLTPIDFQSPGRFALDIPAAIARTSGKPPPPNRELQRFESAIEARRHLDVLLQHARRNLSLYSQDFEPWLYDDEAVEQACSCLLRSNPRCRFRVLLRDSSRAVRQGHRLLRLARRLTSQFQIRLLHPDYQVSTTAFVLVDAGGALACPEPGAFAGYALYHDPGRVRQLQQQFDSAWDHSLSDPELRSFLL